MNMQMGIVRMHVEASQRMVSLDEVVRVQHCEVLGVAMMSETERRVRMRYHSCHKPVLINVYSSSSRRFSLKPVRDAERTMLISSQDKLTPITIFRRKFAGKTSGRFYI